MSALLTRAADGSYSDLAIAAIATVIGLVLLSFLIGALNPASALARLLGRDVRSDGSGNPGATNAGRVLGVKWGVLVGVLDVAKGWLPTFVVLHRVGLSIALICGLAVVLGHMWSPFLRGRGGKGVATAAGAILALEPWFALLGVAVFVIAVLTLRVTGKASIVTCLALLVAAAARMAHLGPSLEGWTGPWYVLVLGLVIARHRRNIVAWWRLRHT